MNEDLVSAIISGLLQGAASGAGSEAKKKTSGTTIAKVKKYSAAEVKRIRSGTGFSVKNFAGYMGVTEETVKAWESGEIEPNGPSSRILTMMEMDAELTTRYPFVKKKKS